MGSISEMLTAVPLHRRPDLLEACADLINEEWKRSRASRIHSLQRSTDDFPMCLVLIKTQRVAEEATEEKSTKTQCQLLGHARLSRVVSQPRSLFVETVVVSKALRGKGFGRKLMEAVESYAKSRNFRRLHLTTHDKQNFYAHLGYSLSKPVQSMGCMNSLIPMKFLEAFSSPPHHDRALPPGSGIPSATVPNLNSRVPGAVPLSVPSSAPPSPSIVPACLPPLPPPPALLPSRSHHSITVAIPPPPPLPPSLSPHSSTFHLSVAAVPPPPLSPSTSPSSTTCPPPPPSLPLPPGAPPSNLLSGQPGACRLSSSNPPGNEACGQTILETPYRDLKGHLIFWMEKAI